VKSNWGFLSQANAGAAMGEGVLRVAVALAMVCKWLAA
jgi:hypothetical protein